MAGRRWRRTKVEKAVGAPVNLEAKGDGVAQGLYVTIQQENVHHG